MFVIFRVLVSCFTAGCLVLFFSLLAGEDLLHSKSRISRIRTLHAHITQELNKGLDNRVRNLGDVPEKEPFRKVYSVELAKEFHEVLNLIEQQNILFDTYNAHQFQIQLKRMMEFAESSNVQGLMDELGEIKIGLKESASILEKRDKRLVRQIVICIVLFIFLWVILYLYFSRGILFKKAAAV